MKANELRIGNWVFDVDQPHQVTGIDSLAVELQNPPPYTASHPQLWEFIKPISLTEEWLLRFGFQFVWKWKNWAMLTSKKGNIHFKTHEGKLYFQASQWRRVWILHVHQLQNLYYALTGEELTLKD